MHLMLCSLDELISLIRATIPHPESIRDVRYQPVLDGLTFEWFGYKFFARNNGEVFELRGRTLYVTGNSLLLQSLIQFLSDRQIALEQLSSALNNIEGQLSKAKHHDLSQRALSQARASLTRLVAQPAHPACGH